MTTTPPLSTPIQKAATSMSNVVAAADAPLTGHDRCDACRVALAAARVTIRPGRALYLCGHHLRHHEAVLAVRGAHIFKREPAAKS